MRKPTDLKAHSSQSKANTVDPGIFAQNQHLVRPERASPSPNPTRANASTKPAILATPSLSLKAVYSRTLASAAALTANLPQKVDWYTDETAAQGRGYEDLLSNTNISAVIVALPIPAQPAFVRRALAVGKHVLSEKPVAQDAREAAELWDWWSLEKARGNRGSWSVAENWRFLDSHALARDKIGELGRISGFRVREQRLTLPGGKYYGQSLAVVIRCRMHPVAWAEVFVSRNCMAQDAGVPGRVECRPLTTSSIWGR